MVLHLLLSGLEVHLEAVPFKVVQAIIDYVGQRHHCEDIPVLVLVELPHVEEKVLLVAQILVVLHLVIHPDKRQLGRGSLHLLRVLAIGSWQGPDGIRLVKGREALDVPLLQPLRPHEVALLKSLLVALYPPAASLLEDSLHEHVIVASSDAVLVLPLRLIDLDHLLCNAIRLVDPQIEGRIHLLFYRGKEILLLQQSGQILLKVLRDLEAEETAATVHQLYLDGTEIL